MDVWVRIHVPMHLWVSSHVPIHVWVSTHERLYQGPGQIHYARGNGPALQGKAQKNQP